MPSIDRRNKCIRWHIIVASDHLASSHHMPLMDLCGADSNVQP